MFIIYYSFIITLVIIAIRQMYLFDCLVRWEYEHHREQWEKDGKPTGYLIWHPKENRFPGTGSEHVLNFIWLFRTPQWALKSVKCQKWLLYKRIIGIVGIIVAGSFIFISK